MNWYDVVIIFRNKNGETIWELLDYDFQAKDDNIAQQKMNIKYGPARWRDE